MRSGRGQKKRWLARDETESVREHSERSELTGDPFPPPSQTPAKAAGYLQIVSTKRKVASRISVDLVARQSLAFPQDARGAREDDEVDRIKVALEDVQLEKGLNSSVPPLSIGSIEEGLMPVLPFRGLQRFQFLLLVPHDAPVSQGMDAHPSFGSVTFYFVGTVHGGGSKGLFGGAPRDLIAEERAWVVAAPSPSREVEGESLSFSVQGALFLQNAPPEDILPLKQNSV